MKVELVHPAVDPETVPVAWERFPIGKWLLQIKHH